MFSISGGLWAGWWDELKEGTWTDINNPKSNETFSVDLWHPVEPNGYERENCALFGKNWKPHENTFLDVFCGRKYCGICDIGAPPTFVLRGLCKRSKFHNRYSWTGQLSEGDKYTFQVKFIFLFTYALGPLQAWSTVLNLKLSHLTRDLSQPEKKINIVTS